MKLRIVEIALLSLLFSCQTTLGMLENFAVTNNNDSGIGSLREAIRQLNEAGVGSHSITFDSGLAQIGLNSNLPMIVGTGQTITIDGAANTVSGKDTFRLIFVAGGNVTVENMTLKDGLADGGDGGDGRGGGGGGAGAGGALFVNSGANVVMKDVNFESNSASGGHGGQSNSASGGGGGGGFSGDGGATTGSAGAGGGGFDGVGGDALSSGGSGGGGVRGRGGNATSSGGGGGGGQVDGQFSGSSNGGDGSDGTPGGSSGSRGSDATIGGGGGGGNLGRGGDGAENGGGGGSGEKFEQTISGGDGGTYGGAGGGGEDAGGGDGGEFGGGGGAGDSNGNSGDGGVFGGGAGSSAGGTAGSGGFGAGDGGEESFGGDAGDAMGGAIFVREGGTLKIIDSNVSGGGLIAGIGGNTGFPSSGANGQTIGSGIFLDNDVVLGIEVDGNVGTGILSIADDLGGDGSLEKTGSGELILSGTNVYNGNTSINAGRLAINGSITSDTTINSTGELGGSGIITGNVINNGTLAAGNSIGTLTITGNATFNSGSNIQVEIQAASNPIAGTDNDLVIAETAIVNGGSVYVQGVSGAYTDGAKYTFLQTNSGVTGEFDSIFDDLAFFDAQLGYEANSVFFTLVETETTFASIGGSGNCHAVGSYIDENAEAANGDFLTVLDDFRMMSTSQVRNGLCQMSGDIYGSRAQVMIQGTSQLIATMSTQLRRDLFAKNETIDSNATGRLDGSTSIGSRSTSSSPVSLAGYSENRLGLPIEEDASFAPRQISENAWRSWSTSYGFGGFSETDRNALGVDYRSGGMLFGIEQIVDHETTIGLFGGYVGSMVSTRVADQTVRSNSVNIGGYLSQTSSEQYGVTIGAFQFDAYDNDRTIQLGTLNRTASSKSDGWQGFAYGERGFNLKLSRSRVLQPFGGLQYIYGRQNAFNESGAGSMGLHLSGIDTHSLRSNTGCRLKLRPRITKSGVLITPEIRGSWLHEFLETSSIMSAQFAGVGHSGFVARGLDFGRDWAIIGGGLGIQLNRRFALNADYNSQFNDRQVFHVGSGNLSFRW